jgi:hypothetical protein
MKCLLDSYLNLKKFRLDYRILYYCDVSSLIGMFSRNLVYFICAQFIMSGLKICVCVTSTIDDRLISVNSDISSIMWQAFFLSACVSLSLKVNIRMKLVVKIQTLLSSLCNVDYRI